MRWKKDCGLVSALGFPAFRSADSAPKSVVTWLMAGFEWPWPRHAHHRTSAVWNWWLATFEMI